MAQSLHTRLCYLVLVALLVGALADSSKGPVVTLTDADFEATTQAATGQTTGRWVVAFSGEWWQQLEEALEGAAGVLAGQGVSVAKVDVPSSPQLVARFQVKEEPVLLLLTQRKMRVLAEGRVLSAKELVAAVEAPADQSVLVDVPPLPKFSIDLVHLYSQAVQMGQEHPSWMVAAGLAIMAIAYIGTSLLLPTRARPAKKGAKARTGASRKPKFM